DYIDLYQAHRDDSDTPLQETLATFDALIKEGKVRAIGASNYSAERLQEALNISKQQGLARYETLQPEYNLYDRQGYESGLEQV
ncbi:aldo/keto reductase, partial [Variovorax sp. 2RAF20]